MILWLLSYAASFLWELSLMPSACEVAFQSAFVALTPKMERLIRFRKKKNTFKLEWFISVCLGGGFGRLLAFVHS